MISIRKAGSADAETIRKVAEVIWYDTYEKMLGPAQVQYMLYLFYDTSKLEHQIETGEQAFVLLRNDDKIIGFAAYSPRDANPDVYKLHKLYCLSTEQKNGYGKLLLDEVEKAVKDAGKNVLELNVNRENPAIGFYRKMGFDIAYAEDIDIGSGYWMNDYVMRKLL